MNYNESKKVIDKIASKYNCKGDIIMRTAVQYIVEYGQNTFKDEEFVADQIKEINARHDAAEAEGKFLFMTRDFEMAIFNCAVELAEVSTYNLIIYMQKEMWWSNEGGMDCQRAKELLTNCMNWMSAQENEDSVLYDVFKYDGDFSDEELEEFGFGDIITEEEEE